MKTTLLVLAAAALSGCAVYPSPAYESYEAPVLVPYGVVEHPAYMYGSVYPYGYRPYRGGYHRPHPHVAPAPASPHSHVPHPGGGRDRIHNRLRHGPPVPHLPGLPRLPHHRR